MSTDYLRRPGWNGGHILPIEKMEQLLSYNRWNEEEQCVYSGGSFSTMFEYTHHILEWNNVCIQVVALAQCLSTLITF